MWNHTYTEPQASANAATMLMTIATTKDQVSRSLRTPHSRTTRLKFEPAGPAIHTIASSYVRACDTIAKFRRESREITSWQWYTYETFTLMSASLRTENRTWSADLSRLHTNKVLCVLASASASQSTKKASSMISSLHWPGPLTDPTWSPTGDESFCGVVSSSRRGCEKTKS